MNKTFTGIVFLPYRSLKGKMADKALPTNAKFIDVSSYGSDGWNALSPFCDHGGIPVPGMPDRTSRTVEGIWQGLKDFSDVGTDLEMFTKGRPKKRRGKPRGHRFGDELVNGVVEARKRIYLPAFNWMLENCPKAQAKYEELVELARTHMVYLYDRESNGDIEMDKPYAHAAYLAQLVKAELKRAVSTDSGVQPQAPN